jgi:hypothetical protein
MQDREDKVELFFNKTLQLMKLLFFVAFTLACLWGVYKIVS